MKKVTSLAVFLVLAVGVVFASNEFLLGPDGKHYQLTSDGKPPKEAIKIEDMVRPEATLNRDDFELKWPDGGSGVNFGFGTGDSIAQYLVPPAGCVVKSIELFNVNFAGNFKILLHESNYAGEATSGACADGAGWVGYWGYLDANGDTVQTDPFNPEAGSFWVAGDNECFSASPFGAELWPAMGIGGWQWNINTEQNDPDNSWYSLDLSVAGYPDIGSMPFFINGVATQDAGWGINALGSPVTPYHSWKYYLGAGTSGNAGWHIRSYGWDLFAMVEYYEDPGPFIVDMTSLGPTISTDPREVCATVTDINPTTTGNAGVADVELQWSINGGATVSATMTADADTFCAEITGAIAGDDVEYWIVATDVESNITESSHLGYSIFAPTEPNLVINNGDYPDWIIGYSLNGLLGDFVYDVWNVNDLGATPAVLYPNYETIVELQPEYTYTCGDEPKDWLDEGGKNWLITGDEWMNACYDGWVSTDYGPGDFIYDYMGIDQTYPDISGTSDGVSRLEAVADDAISGELAAFLSDSLLLNYDPNYEIDADNWLDGVDVTGDATASYYGYEGVLDADLNVDPGAASHATGAYVELANGSQVAWFSFESLSLNTMAVDASALHDAGYHWIGTYPEGPIPQALDWMDAYASIDDEVAQVPSTFALHQNYPNPFNPTTTISYDLPNDGNVTLTVYNMLGQKVTTVVNEFKNAGSHTVSWNGKDDLGRGAATGVYLYRIEASEFSAAKKMILLR